MYQYHLNHMKPCTMYHKGSKTWLKHVPYHPWNKPQKRTCKTYLYSWRGPSAYHIKPTNLPQLHNQQDGTFFKIFQNHLLLAPLWPTDEFIKPRYTFLLESFPSLNFTNLPITRVDPLNLTSFTKTHLNGWSKWEVLDVYLYFYKQLLSLIVGLLVLSCYNHFTL